MRITKNGNGQLKANELKQTIISQIEIEKLRARIDELREALVHTERGQTPQEYIKRVTEQLQEKLKE